MEEKKRKVGRPKLPKGEVRNVIAIRLTGAEKRDYEKRATHEGLSLSDWIRRALQRIEMEPPQAKPTKCRHCKQLFIPGPNKVGYFNECPNCSMRYA
jgi:hypothetical protein